MDLRTGLRRSDSRRAAGYGGMVPLRMDRAGWIRRAGYAPDTVRMDENPANTVTSYASVSVTVTINTGHGSVSPISPEWIGSDK